MDQEELEKMVNTIFSNVEANTGKIQALTEQCESDYKELEDLRRAREIPTLIKTPSRTPWRQSKNPAIEWCPEQEAHIDDLKLAKSKMNDMWYAAPRNGYKNGSIFIKR